MRGWIAGNDADRAGQVIKELSQRSDNFLAEEHGAKNKIRHRKSLFKRFPEFFAVMQPKTEDRNLHTNMILAVQLTCSSFQYAVVGGLHGKKYKMHKL